MTDQSDTTNQPIDGPASPDGGDRQPGESGKLPRLALAVVLVGLVASALIYGLSFVPGSGSQEVDWDSKEAIEAPDSQTLGDGSFSVTRTSLASLAPNANGTLLYRVAGAVRVDSGGRKPTRVRCDVISKSKGDTAMARSTRLRAAWPKPSENLIAQDFPEVSFVRHITGDATKLDLPVRDVARQYTDVGVPTTVKWVGAFVENHMNWVWFMSDGTGPGAATLPWLVIFEAEDRPVGTIECTAKVGSSRADVKIPFRQQEWPIEDDQPNPGDSDTGDVSNVE